MNYDYENEWEFIFMNSNDELKNDKIQNDLKWSTKKSSDYENKNQKEMNNWIRLIIIITEDIIIKESSSFYIYNKSIWNISILFLNIDILNYIMSLMMKDMSIWIFKYMRRIILFIIIYSILSVKDIISHFQSNLVLHSTWISFSYFIKYTWKNSLRNRSISIWFIFSFNSNSVLK